MRERKLIAAAMKSREAYEVIAQSPVPGALDEVLAPVWAGVQGFYERDPDATEFDPDVGTFPRQSNPKRNLELSQLASEIYGTDVSEANVRHMVLEQVRETRGMALAAALAGHKPEQEIADALAAYQDAVEPQDTGGVPEGPDWAGELTARIECPCRRVYSINISTEGSARVTMSPCSDDPNLVRLPSRSRWPAGSRGGGNGYST
jgi:hypothetical protein